MLKKTNRLCKRSDFLEIRKLGKIYQSPIFGLAVLRSSSEEKLFGIIVSKKISKLAVKRNKIRRLISLAIRENLDKVPNGVRGLFLVKKNILEANGDQIRVEVRKVIEKLLI